MERGIKFLVGLFSGMALGAIGGYSLCSMMTSELRPWEWESGIKAFCAFIIAFSIFSFIPEREED